MQLLHTISDLQGCVEWDQVVAMMNYSQEWCDKHALDGYSPPDVADKGDVDFVNKFNKVRLFRDFVPPKEKTKWRRCPVCVLTRWQWTGLAAKYGFDNYLCLLKFTQLCINGYKSDNKVNSAASDLQSMLLEPLFYSDITLLIAFHDSYFKEHLDWFLQNDDLTKVTGFQSHQIVTRCYLMNRDQLQLIEDMNQHNGFFHHFNRSLTLVGEHGPLHNDAAQKNKAMKFVDTAMISLHKHFQRWVSPSLLPAALLSEGSLAKAVARVILNTASPHPPEPLRADFSTEEEHVMASVVWDDITHCRSKAQKRGISVPYFERWLQDVRPGSDLEEAPLHSERVRQASQLTLQDVDFRKCGSHALANELWSTFLPLASQTQFVERGVKEAKIVSATGRREEQRTAHAIVRSFTPPVSGIERESSAPDRIEALLSSVDQVIKRKASLILAHGADWCKTALGEAKKHLHSSHFRNERVDGLIDSVMSVAEKNKPENVRQQMTGVLTTAAAAGLIQCSKLNECLHCNDLIAELQFREGDMFCPPDHEDTKKKGKLKNFTELRNDLKRLEQDRVSGNKENEEMAKKGFKIMSEASFKLD